MEEIMSKLGLAFILLVSGIAQGAAWEKVLDCDRGAAIIDVNKDERRSLQLVVRNTGILSYLNQKGAISLKFGETEAIEYGWQNNAVFQPSDFHSMKGQPKNMWDNRIVYANREGSGLKVRFVDRRSYTEKPAGCEDCLSMACESACKTISYDVELANWYFQSCE
jgi:hypothetical protein